MITAEQERSKYSRMWAYDGYRSNSPGEHLVSKFLATAPWKRGESLIDLGSGTGRASALLADAGLDVTMFDITGDCTDRLVKKRNLPFIEGCLWDMPRALSFDWAYCCDVLEHMPTERVDACLDAIKAVGRKGAFMQIALFKDGCGARIGETLHLTVKPAAWWTTKLEERWRLILNHSAVDRLIAFGVPR